MSRMSLSFHSVASIDLGDIASEEVAGPGSTWRCITLIDTDGNTLEIHCHGAADALKLPQEDACETP